ncbi:MAG: hypothetical protein LBE23_05875 [Vagococcus sp.]|nr:hypothetical protein [Vagococcus sp.]
MANLTKEERVKREALEKEQLRKEIEEQVRSEIGKTSNDEILIKENENLKTKLSEMMNMIKEFQGKSSESTKELEANNSYVSPTDEEESTEMNARISITSMTTGGVNMKTSNDGSARHFRLDKIGQTIPIIYEHLINCINTDRWLFEEGLVYINNSNVVKEQYLEEFYQKFITPEKIENIMDFDVSTIKNMVKTTTTTIQETISTLVAEKINKGGFIDMNKVEAIGSACTPSIDIRDLANKLR